MPTPLNPREVLAVHSWRSFQQNEQSRTKSTSAAQLAKTWDENALAVLHGGQRTQQPNFQPIKPPGNNHPQINRAYQENSNRQSEVLSRISPQSGRRESTRSSKGGHGEEHGRERARANTSQVLKRGASRHRSPALPSARRPLSGPNTESINQLKDENYIRDTMYVPTAKDYPGIRSSIFANLKSSMRDAMQSNAEFQSGFSMIGRDAFRCTLTCKFIQELQSEVVIGEGRTKVRHHNHDYDARTTVKFF